jgi:hypothetical protein
MVADTLVWGKGHYRQAVIIPAMSQEDRMLMLMYEMPRVHSVDYCRPVFFCFK